MFAYGRFREGARAPYSAWGEALGELVRVMEASPSGERDRWRAELTRGASTLAAALGGLVPGLDAVLGDLPAVTDLDAADRRRRLQRAVVALVAATASYRQVVLALDDLQWADHDSVLALAELLAGGRWCATSCSSGRTARAGSHGRLTLGAETRRQTH